jgi:DNA-binding NarL/FixJ family response regulator
MKTVRIGLVDDHQLFLKSLSSLISTFDGFEVVVEALHGQSLQERMVPLKSPPDIILVDVNMPVMDGFNTVNWLVQTHPAIKCIALSMKDDETSIMGMVRAGCCAYLLKDIHPSELEKALHEVAEKGYYNTDAPNPGFRRVIRLSQTGASPSVTEKEKEFIKLACSDLTYKEIASRMNLSERTIDGYREALFHKLNVQSRVGLALEAIRRNLVSI